MLNTFLFVDHYVDPFLHQAEQFCQNNQMGIHVWRIRQLCLKVNSIHFNGILTVSILNILTSALFYSFFYRFKIFFRYLSNLSRCTAQLEVAGNMLTFQSQFMINTRKNFLKLNFSTSNFYVNNCQLFKTSILLTSFVRHSWFFSMYLVLQWEFINVTINVGKTKLIKKHKPDFSYLRLGKFSEMSSLVKGDSWKKHN